MLTQDTKISPSAEVSYDHETHTYYYGNTWYRSATQVVDQFRNCFDTVERTAYMAHRYGQTPEYWEEKWKSGNRQSLERGNNIHNEQEDFLYNRGFTPVAGKIFRVWNLNAPNFCGQIQQPPYNSPVEGYLCKPLDFYQEPRSRELLALPDGTFPELKIWRHDYAIAGRMDKPTIETTGTGRYLHIEDYKTNRKIAKEGFNGAMMTGPLSHLPDAEWYHYAFQLSLYQFMGEYHGFKPGIRRLIHFQHEIEGLGTPAPVVHELPYLRGEVIEALNHLTQTQWLKQPLNRSALNKKILPTEA